MIESGFAYVYMADFYMAKAWSESQNVLNLAETIHSKNWVEQWPLIYDGMKYIFFSLLFSMSIYYPKETQLNNKYKYSVEQLSVKL